MATLANDAAPTETLATDGATVELQPMDGVYVKEVVRAQDEAAVDKLIANGVDEHEAEAMVRTGRAAMADEASLQARVAEFDAAVGSGGALHAFMAQFGAHQIEAIVAASKVPIETLMALSSWANHIHTAVRRLHRRQEETERVERRRKETIANAERLHADLVEAAGKVAAAADAYRSGDFSHTIPPDAAKKRRIVIAPSDRRKRPVYPPLVMSQEPDDAEERLPVPPPLLEPREPDAALLKLSFDALCDLNYKRDQAGFTLLPLHEDAYVGRFPLTFDEFSAHKHRNGALTKTPIHERSTLIAQEWHAFRTVRDRWARRHGRIVCHADFMLLNRPLALHESGGQNVQHVLNHWW